MFIFRQNFFMCSYPDSTIGACAVGKGGGEYGHMHVGAEQPEGWGTNIFYYYS